MEFASQIVRRSQVSTAVALFCLLLSGDALAAEIRGTEYRFNSASGVQERCIEIEALPGANYHGSDAKATRLYCSLDFSELALCPKLWSTSPGTIVYRLPGTPSAGFITEFEAAQCDSGHHVSAEHMTTLKLSVNGAKTSGTYAPSSWVYFHLSRLLDTNTYVPPAVYRSMDRELHLQRVSQPGLNISKGRHGLGMLSAGWEQVVAIEEGTLGGSAAGEMLEDDDLVFGVMLNSKGDRYGVEMNGTRESGWGKGQNYDFQQTPAFLALRQPGPLMAAAAEGLHQARKDPRMAKAVSADMPLAQVVLWMNDVLEITLLDYLLSQQDRIGNLDWRWYWYWVEDNRLNHQHAHESTPPDDLVAKKPLRFKRSAINDNDAGVRSSYANFARTTGMLKGLRHYNPGLYERFYRLANDLAVQGPVYQWLGSAAGLSEREVNRIAERAAEALQILVTDCESGALQLDLIPIVAFGRPAPDSDSSAGSCRPDAP